jgi:hypothetical protein
MASRPDPILTDARRTQRSPYRGHAPRALRHGEARRYILAAAGVDVHEAIAAALLTTWACAIVVRLPTLASKWWVFTIDVARLP